MVKAICCTVSGKTRKTTEGEKMKRATIRAYFNSYTPSGAARRFQEAGYWHAIWQAHEHARNVRASRDTWARMMLKRAARMWLNAAVAIREQAAV